MGSSMEKDGKTIGKVDCLVAVASGTLCAAADAIWIKDISLLDAYKTGSDEVERLVNKIAESKITRGKSLKGNSLDKTIKNLEEEYPMSGDDLTNQFGGGTQHHLRDFSHHPTPLGLLFSILMQFTGYGYGTDTAGKFSSFKLPSWKKPSFVQGIYLGTVEWLFHLISDIAGSSGSVAKGKPGTGLPGPMLSAVKMLSSVPGVRNIAGKTTERRGGGPVAVYDFSQTCSKLFNGTLLADVEGHGIPFDFRTELGIVSESIANKQYIPVIMNELVVSAFYSVSRFIDEIDKCTVNNFSDLSNIDVRRCLPWNNAPLRHMRMISSVTFSTIDITTAGVKAAIKNKGDKKGFALDLLQDVNYWGLGDLFLATNSEAAAAVANTYHYFENIVNKKKDEILASIPNGEEWLYTIKMAGSTYGAVTGIGTPIGFVSAAIGVYTELEKSFKEYAAAKKMRVETEQICAARIKELKENQEIIDRAVSDFFVEYYELFDLAFKKMDHAIVTNDSDEFIEGNTMIQKKLGYDTQFENQEEFDGLMDMDDSFKL